MMKVTIGSFGLYLEGFEPSMIPPCGGALFDAVGSAPEVVPLAVEDDIAEECVDA